MSLFYPQKALLFCVTALLLFGLLMIYSTTSFEILDADLQSGRFIPLLKQLMYLVAGLFLGAFLIRMGSERLWEMVPVLFWGVTFLLVLTLIPGIGREVNGSRRWLSILGLSFQPSEFSKLIVPLFFAFHYLKMQKELDWSSFLKLLGTTFIPIGLIMVEPNNGTALVVMMTVIVVFFVLKVPFRFWGWPLVVVTVVGALFALNHPYVQKRLYVFWHPEADLRGKGHQPYQAKIAIGSGGLLGKGLGNSLQKLHYLPEAQNDYIGAIVAEELGFFGIVLLTAFYMGMSLAAALIVIEQKAPFRIVMGSIILFLISFPPFLNLGVVSSLLPSTGLNLPLFSQGGTSLMANMAFIALLLSFRRGDG